MSEEEFNPMDNEVFDLEELDVMNIKINPDFYIHDTLLKAANALGNPNMQDRFLQYRQFIEHLEILCRAAHKLPPDYDEQIKTFKETKEFKETDDKTVKSSILVNKKLELILGDVFKNRTITTPLKFSHFKEKLTNRINELEAEKKEHEEELEDDDADMPGS